MTVVAIGQDYRLIEPNIILQPTICSLLIHLSNDDLGAMPDRRNILLRSLIQFRRHLYTQISIEGD